MTRGQTSPTTDFVRQARAGNAAVWESIVADFGPVIRGYARARGVADPDDLTQDVFTAAAQRIGAFEGDRTAFRSWLFSIAYRQIVNRYRRSTRTAEALPPDLRAANPSPEDEVIDRLEAGAAVAALDVLGDLERDVVLLRVLGGLDTNAVAGAIGRRPGNVRIIQFRALAKLREELERRGYRRSREEPK